MVLFKKKQKGVVSGTPPKLPEIPKLPELPELPGAEERPAPRLPSYPTTSLGEKEDEGFGKDEFAPEEYKGRRIPKPLTQLRRDIGEMPAKAENVEPVFIRIDKFEESLKTFENIKRQISDIETMLSDIKKIKEDEDVELTHWERETASVKEQIEKIDRDIFSKVR